MKWRDENGHFNPRISNELDILAIYVISVLLILIFAIIYTYMS